MTYEQDQETRRTVTAPALDELLDTFWTIGAQIEQVVIRIGAPEIEGEILKIFGKPDFDVPFMERLPQVYAQVSARALAVAFGQAQAADPATEADGKDV